MDKNIRILQWAIETGSTRKFRISTSVMNYRKVKGGKISSEIFKPTKYSSVAEHIATLWYYLKYNDDINTFHQIPYSTAIREPRVATEEPVRRVHQEKMAQFEVAPVQAAEGAAEAGKPGVP